mgnify:CR=1 FL=1
MRKLILAFLMLIIGFARAISPKIIGNISSIIIYCTYSFVFVFCFPYSGLSVA